MKLTTTLITASLLAVLFFLLNSSQGKLETYHHPAPSITLSSVNPPAGRTGAPGESNCTGCHAGTTQSADGVIDVTFSGAGNEYVVGQSYAFTISITAGAKNGFEATILDAADSKAGTFTAGTNYSLTNSSGRQYVRQSVSSGITSWTFNWTAPANDLGDLTLYYAFNKSNASGTTSGDVIYLGQFNISSAIFNTVTEYEKTDEHISLWYDAQNQLLKMDYKLFNTSDVILSVQDLSGKLMIQQNLGTFENGSYSDSFQLIEKPESGIYIVSLFIDNSVYNRRIFIE